MSKSDRIVTRLEPDARARLHAKASALGLDDATYVRMLIYRDLNDLEVMHHSGRSAQPLHNARPLLAPEPAGADEPEPLPVEEMDIPPDADGGEPATLDDLLRAGPSLLDEMAGATRAPAGAQMLAQMAAPRTPQRSYRPSRQVVPFGRPGSLTRPVGINADGIGFAGDSPNGVRADNMRHFGFVGTRAR
jgi:hypothetical protein